ncbi:MAG: hypothetical protein IPK37_05035 [Austwickia sp.]|jgi:hypothetical protein|nr:MAG: hypothetical protein IPK37_05035 [Austwickia sp.]
MAERVRRALAVLFLAAAVVAAILVPVRGITPVPGLLFLTMFLVATAAKPEPGAERDDHSTDASEDRLSDRFPGPG